MARYQYQSFKDARKELRILHLEAGQPTDVLSATIQHVIISERPQYEALSYCWGSSETPSNLCVQQESEGFVIPITKNLDLALRRLRHETSKRSLWVDAVCINQEDDGEKSQQVLLMSEIYAAAQQVLVHLGEPDDTVRQGLSMLRRVHRAAQDAPRGDSRPPAVFVAENQLPNVMDPEAWAPLKAFLLQPWFRRKWTIQEAAVAVNLTFLCGPWSSDWSFMSLAIKTTYDKGLPGLDWTTCQTFQEARELAAGLSQMNGIRLLRDQPQTEGDWDLIRMIYKFQVSEATDPRDHIFALLAMAGETTDESLKPEYKSSKGMVDNCVHFARHLLLRDRKLDVLYYAGLNMDEPLAPSWIPNWYGGYQPFALEPNEGVWDPRSRPKHFGIAQSSSIRVVPGYDQGHVLGLQGIIIDTVTQVANEHLKSPQEDDWRDKLLLIKHRMAHLRQSDVIVSHLTDYCTGETLEDVQWRTLMCNTTRDRQIPSQNYRNIYRIWRRSTLRESAPDRRSQDIIDAQPFDQAVHGCNMPKLFGRTEHAYVGMFPKQTLEGDRIAMLYGGDFPFVLRPLSDNSKANFRLVGQCYVHGIMQEGQQHIKFSESKAQDILLE